MNEPPSTRLQRFGKLGTIDLRVDCLRPAVGARFELRAVVLRLSSRVASTHMEFCNGNGMPLSVGAAAYIVSQPLRPTAPQLVQALIARPSLQPL